MADTNPFDLLADDELTEDPSQLIAAKAAAASAKKASAQTPKPAPQLPSKPLPPAQAVRETKPDPGQSGGRRYGRGRGFKREQTNEEHAPRSRESSSLQGAGPEVSVDARRPFERREGYIGSRGSFHRGRRGGFAHGDLSDGERPRRVYDRLSGFRHGNDVNREGSGRGNWGTATGGLALVIEEGVDEGGKDPTLIKPSGEEFTTEVKVVTSTDDAGEKEHEEKEMTLEEYEKVLEEKRKALQALRTEERKVDTQVFESMQSLNKKNSDDIFIQLGGKDKKKEYAEKEEKAKKSLSIGEFLKSAEGEKFYPSGRGLNLRRGYREDSVARYADVPSIEDPGQFPTLAGK